MLSPRIWKGGERVVAGHYLQENVSENPMIVIRKIMLFLPSNFEI